MTRRERLERKLEKRQEWAAGRAKKSTVAYEKSRAAVAGIPFGQPILVGHHSEGRHRRDVERSHAAMGQCVEHSKMSEHHESKARGIERALETSIFDDDPDAIEKLEEKIRGLEAVAEKSKAINKAWRKGGRDVVAAAHGEEIAAAAVKVCAQFSWLARKGPMDLTHDRAEIRRCQKRIETIRQKQARAQRAEQAGGVMLDRVGAHLQVTFAEKPEYSVIVALKGAGFHWSSGSWWGAADKLPESVRELAAEAAAAAGGVAEAVEVAS